MNTVELKKLPTEDHCLNRNFSIEVVRVTEAAAIESYPWIGKGNEKAADQAAVNAMRKALNKLDINGTVVIGEGERDEAPMLYIGEKVGSGKGPEIDIALDPLEGTTICAHGANNSLAVLAIAEKGGLLHAPDVYMQKIAVGANLPEGIINLKKSPSQNLQNIADAKNVKIADLKVIILNRPRHQDIIDEIRKSGACIQLITDGDIAAVMATSMDNGGADMYIGTGGAPEGVLAAAALRAIGGQIQGKLLFRNDDEKNRAFKIGITDLDRIYHINDLAKGDVIFAATGVTDGSMLKGVKKLNNGFYTHSVVMRSKTSTVRFVEAYHNLNKKNF